jgi:hypothetical protein
MVKSKINVPYNRFFFPNLGGFEDESSAANQV